MLLIRCDGPSLGTSRGELIRGNGADGFIIAPPPPPPPTRVWEEKTKERANLTLCWERFHLRATMGEADWLTTKPFL